MLLVPQWITICLIAGGNYSFFPRHNNFSTLFFCIPQFNVFFLKNEFHAFVYLESPWINESPSNTVCIFFLYLMPTYVVGVIYAIPVHKIVQRVLIFATVRGCILTVCGHSLVRVSIWYSSLWCVVLLSSFWCFKEIYDPVKLWKFKIKRKPLEKSVFSRQLLHL